MCEYYPLIIELSNPTQTFPRLERTTSENSSNSSSSPGNNCEIFQIIDRIQCYIELIFMFLLVLGESTMHVNCVVPEFDNPAAFDENCKEHLTPRHNSKVQFGKSVRLEICNVNISSELSLSLCVRKSLAVAPSIYVRVGILIYLIIKFCIYDIKLILIFIID